MEARRQVEQTVQAILPGERELTGCALRCKGRGRFVASTDRARRPKVPRSVCQFSANSLERVFPLYRALAPRLRSKKRRNTKVYKRNGTD